MNKLQNKIAVITGGNSGIGFATAKTFKEQGAKVIITGRKQNLVDEAVNLIGGIKGIVSDQSNLAAIDNLVENVKLEYGTIDILFINAGVAKFSPIEQTTEEVFDEVMDINFKGAFFTLSKFIPLLNDGASVIFLSSVSSFTAMAGSAVYGASKAAMSLLVKVASTELSPRKIRVNAVSPGPIATPIFEKVGMEKVAAEEMGTAMTKRIPLNRLGTAEEVANLISFLASNDSLFINGSDYVIDGGISLNPFFN